MTPEPFVIVLFATVHQTLKMESRLEKEGIPYRTIAKPRSISEECGVVLRISREDIGRVQSAASREECTIKGVYRQINHQWSRID